MKARTQTLLAATVLCGATLAAPVGMTPASAADTGTLKYVALGDSFAAEPLVLPADTSSPQCVRSLSDYPHVVAQILNASLTDVSCSGAKVKDMSGSQFPGVAPQYDALTPDTDVVSITIGANDVNNDDVWDRCVNLLPWPLGTSCAQTFTQGGTDKVGSEIDAMAPQFDTVLTTIHQRAPHAKVFVVSYGDYFRPGGCWPTQPYWSADADYVQGAINHLGTALQRTAVQHGDTFVNAVSLSTGHDSCAWPADRWIEGVVPLQPAFPMHPNANGARAYGTALATAVRNALRPGTH